MAREQPPLRLYKYVPREFLSAVLDGQLLFRNLSYFRRVEDMARGDPAEGMHIDKPDSGITLSSLDGGVISSGRYSFQNEIDQDRVFAYCLSTQVAPALFAEFSCDAAVEVVDVPSFLLRIGRAIRGHPRLAKVGMKCGRVEYYHQNRPAKSNVQDPQRIPFFKPMRFSHQAEYRVVCAEKRGLDVRHVITNECYSLVEDASEGRSRHRMLTIGDIRHLVRVRNTSEVDPSSH